VAKRRDSWTIENTDYDTEEQFRAAVADELARFEHIGYRQGFGLVAAPVRQRVGEGIVTLGWEFSAERIPLVGGQPQQAGPMPEAPEPEPEPVEDAEPEEEPQDFPEPAAVGEDPYAE
jgi:hypothetical protein